MAIDIEVVGQTNPESSIDYAFDILRQAHARNHAFTREQKDFGILLSIDALAPMERPWFFEIAATLKAPLWQVLWGQFRRCQEWGQANAPLMDPGWEKDRGYPEEILKPRGCDECGNVFTPKNSGQKFCSNYCGSAEERRKLQRQREEEREKMRRVLAREPQLVKEMNLGEEAPSPQRPQLANVGSPFAQLTQNIKNEEGSVNLGTDYADTQGD